jgi:hypothetical protein
VRQHGFPTSTGPPTITDSLGVHLDYTLLQHTQRSDGNPTCDRCASVFTAVVRSSAAMSISLSTQAGASWLQSTCKVWVLTDSGGGTPTIGASSKGAQASGGAVAASYVATATDSQGFALCDDWDAGGVPTAGSGTTVDAGDAADQGTIVAYAYGRRTTADGTAGSTTTCNFTAGTSANLGWVAAEVVPPAPTPDAYWSSQFAPGDGPDPASRFMPDPRSDLSPAAGLFLDGTSPAAVRDAAATTQLTYTPANNRLLVAFCHADANSGATGEQLTVSSTGGLTWTLAARFNGGVGSDVEVWTTQVGTSPGPITISLVDNQGAVDKSLYLRAFGDTSGATPAGIGATATSIANAVSVVTTVDNSWVWALGLGSNSATLVSDPGDTVRDSVVGGAFDGGDNIWTSSKVDPTPVHGTTVTVTTNGPSTIPHHLAVEILPAAVAGGASLTRTASDTAIATDTAVRGALSFTRAATDTAQAVDAAARIIVAARTATDAANATDATTRALVQARTANSTAAATDAAVRAALTLTRAVGDTAIATDAITRALALARTAADAAIATDVAAGAPSKSRTASDAAIATDAATRGALTLARTATDTAAATDTASRALVLARTAADVAQAVDAAVRGAQAFTRTANSTAAATDAAVRGPLTLTRTATDTAAGTDAATRALVLPRTATDVASATDAAARGALALSRSANSAAAATDAATRTVVLARTANSTAAATDAAVGVYTPAGGTARSAADTAVATDTAARTLTQTRTANSAAAATDSASGTVTVARSTNSAASATDIAVRGWSASRTAGDTAVAADVATRAVQAFIRTATDAAVATDTAVRAVARTRTAADSAPATDAAVSQINRTRTASDTAQAADVAVRAPLALHRFAADVAIAVDAITSELGAKVTPGALAVAGGRLFAGVAGDVSDLAESGDRQSPTRTTGDPVPTRVTGGRDYKGVT